MLLLRRILTLAVCLSASVAIYAHGVNERDSLKKRESIWFKQLKKKTEEQRMATPKSPDHREATPESPNHREATPESPNHREIMHESQDHRATTRESQDHRAAMHESQDKRETSPKSERRPSSEEFLKDKMKDRISSKDFEKMRLEVGQSQPNSK